MRAKKNVDSMRGHWVQGLGFKVIPDLDRSFKTPTVRRPLTLYITLSTPGCCEMRRTHCEICEIWYVIPREISRGEFTRRVPLHKAHIKLTWEA